MSGKRPRIPSDWGGMVVGCADGKKKKKKQGDGCCEGAGDDALAPSSIESAFENIMQSIDRAHQDTKPCRDINLDSILSRVPYKEMLQDLFGGSGVKSPSIPIVTKAYEESFMRPPVHPSERKCVQGPDCECSIIGKGDGFVGVEFCIPGSTLATGRGMCVLCHRKLVQSLFYDIVYASVPCKAVIQKYGNICGQDNEYAREVTLVCPHNGPVHCMPFPSVSHQRNRYRLDTNSNGIKYIRQVGMSHQDFHKAPSKDSK